MCGNQVPLARKRNFRASEVLEEPKRQVLFDLIDTYIRDAKTRKAHAG